jgi:hypothetical protein
MFWSTELAVCEANRDNSYQYAFICHLGLLNHRTA